MGELKSDLEDISVNSTKHRVFSDMLYELLVRWRSEIQNSYNASDWLSWWDNSHSFYQTSWLSCYLATPITA
jgi:hypothetical protein